MRNGGEEEVSDQDDMEMIGNKFGDALNCWISSPKSEAKNKKSNKTKEREQN